MSKSAIIDQYGTPYQTSFNPVPVITVDGKRPNTQEIAAAATDVDMFQGWLPVMENTDTVLNQEGGGNISLYDQIGRDPRVGANLRTRAKAVVGREWQIVPFSQEAVDLRIADYVEQVFKKFPYDLCRRPVLRGGVLKGYSVAEIMWGYSEGDTYIDAMRYRHQRRFRFAPNGDLHLMTLGNPYPGVNVTIDQTTGLPLRKFQTFTFGDEATTPYGNGLGQELYWPWWFKKNGIKYWLIFIEKFAAPTAAGEYEDGTDPGKQQQLLSAAAALHSNSAIIYPKGMSLRLIEAARGGNISSYKELCEFMNEEMTICILGQLATTSGTPGKLGNSQEQEAVYLDYIKDDADSLCEAQNDHQNGVIPWLVDYQFPGHGRYPAIWVKTEDEEDGKTLAERDDKLASAMDKSGLKLTRTYYIRSHGLEEDDVEEKAITPPVPPLTKGGNPIAPGGGQGGQGGGQEKAPPLKVRGGGGGVSSFAETGADLFPDQDALDRFVAGLTTPAELQELMNGVLKPVFTAIEKGKDLQQVFGSLPDLFTSMDTTRIEEILARAFFIAAVWGRISVEEENGNV